MVQTNIAFRLINPNKMLLAGEIRVHFTPILAIFVLQGNAKATNMISEATDAYISLGESDEEEAYTYRGESDKESDKEREEEEEEPSIKFFNPRYSQQHQNVPKDILIAYDPLVGVQNIRYFAGPYQLEKDESSVVLQIDGACRGYGTQYARGAWGVFFGPESHYNIWGLLPPDAPQTITFAELYSLMIALEKIGDELPPVERYFILSDSRYLYEALASVDSVEDRRLHSGGDELAHWNFLLEIKQVIDGLVDRSLDLELKFWPMSQGGMNTAAEVLANRAFN